MRSSATVFLVGLALFTIFVQIEGKKGKFACKDKDADENDESALKNTIECLEKAVDDGSQTNCDEMVDACVAQASKALSGCAGKSKAADKVGKMMKSGMDKVKEFACSGKMPTKEQRDDFMKDAKQMMEKGKKIIKEGIANWKKKDHSGETFS